jgi:hypothetical protein
VTQTGKLFISELLIPQTVLLFIVPVRDISDVKWLTYNDRPQKYPLPGRYSLSDGKNKC